jgi:hypothetical protein
MPNWIDDELERVAELHADQPSDEQVSQAVQRWWDQLGSGIREDVERMRRRDLDAEFLAPQANCYEVRNPAGGLVLSVELDPEARTVHFDYRSESEQAAAPEGGFLSLRCRGAGHVVAFYADQEMTPDRVLRTLLKPVLFPAEPTEEAA